MYKIFFFFAVCLLFTANVCSQTNTNINPNGYNVIYHTNGKISSEGMMRDGKPDGYWKSYFATGVMSSEGNRVNFLRDSTWVFYINTGDTAEIINYRFDKKSGYRYLYDTSTERNSISRRYLKLREIYLDDKREGSAYYYYPSGKIRQIIPYRNGWKHGVSKIYDENGTVITLEEYYNDHMSTREYINRVNEKGEKNGTWKTFYPDGKLKEEEYYKNGVLDGAITLYSEKGFPISGRTYREGKVIEEGPQIKVEPIDLTSYWEDGVTIKRKGTYLDSIPTGSHYFFNREGKPEKRIDYIYGIRIREGSVDENSRRTGKWEIFSETGELRSTGNYVNDRQHGEWRYFFKNGQKEQIGNFNNGIMEGEWKWFFPSGNILREETYVNSKPNGLCIQYSDSGTIVAKGEYNLEGEREGQWIEHIGHSREEGKYTMGLKEGIWKTYYDDNRLHHTGNFVQGVPDGRHLIYYPDGTLKEEQYYVMGRRDKNWKKYYENGALFLTITYRNDEEIRINGMRIEDVRGK